MAESSRSSKDSSNEKHRKRQKNRDKSEMSDSKGVAEGWTETIPECAVCLQTCVHPAKLPCSHIFCFLCLKGLATQSRRCAMCRQDIPLDYLDHPQLLEVPTQAEKEAFEDGYQWFYEGRSGWWQYDERTSRELEVAYKSGQRNCELLIVGQLYIADFNEMLQLRRNDMSRRRRIKRDLASIPKKGIAGLRLDGSTVPDNGDVAVPSTSQQPALNRPESEAGWPDRVSNEETGSPLANDSWQNDRGEADDFLLSNGYRNVEETDESDEDQAGVEHEEETSEERELNCESEPVNDESSDSDQADLVTQLSDLLLH